MMWSEILVGFGTALGKNLVGWIKNSVADGEIQTYEYKQLIETVIVTMFIFSISYFGLSWVDVDNAEWISSVVSLMVSPLWNAIFKKKK